MEWHIDDVLYEPKQIEVVLTIDNTSDCRTMWKPHDRPIIPNNNNNNKNHHSNNNESKEKYEIRSTQTTPNSALILEAGGVEHKVSSLKVGKRAVLKTAFARERGAVPLEGMEGHASHHNGKTKQKKKKNRGGGKKRK